MDQIASELGLRLCWISVLRTLKTIVEIETKEEENDNFPGSIYQYAYRGDLKSIRYLFETSSGRRSGGSERSTSKEERKRWIRNQRDRYGRTILHWSVVGEEIRSLNRCKGRQIVKELKEEYDSEAEEIKDRLGWTTKDYRRFLQGYVPKTIRLQSKEEKVEEEDDDSFVVVNEDPSTTTTTTREHRFWGSQPMSLSKDTIGFEASSSSSKRFRRIGGRVRHMTPESAKRTGALHKTGVITAPPGMTWCVGPRADESVERLALSEILTALFEANEDDISGPGKAMFGDRMSLEASKALWTYKLTVGDVVFWGLRRDLDRTLMAVIAGTPTTVRLCDHDRLRLLEIHSLFVRPEARGRRLTPLLVQRMIVHGMRIGVQHAIHTHRRRLPIPAPPIATLTYYWRPLRVAPLLAVGRLRPRVDRFETPVDVALSWALPARSKAFVANGFRRRRLRGIEDARAALDLLRRSDRTYALAPSFADAAELASRWMPDNHDEIRTYGVFDESSRLLCGLFAFYTLTTSDGSLRTSVALGFASSSSSSLRRSDLVLEWCDVALADGYDAAYALDAYGLAPSFRSLRFRRMNDENVHYYVYNYACTPPLRPREVAFVLP